MSNVTVRPGDGRFEALVDGEQAGFAEYRDRDGVRVFPHTVVDPAFEGKGVGSALVRGALDATRAEGLRVEARCSFVAGWIGKHPEYQDLLA